MKKMSEEAKRRFILYIIAKFAAVFVVILIAIYGFFLAKQTMTVNVMVKDAVLKQIEEVYMPGSVDEAILERIFTEEYLNKSGIVNAPQEGYGVTAVNKTVHTNFKLVGVLSFSTSVKADITINSVSSSVKEGEAAPKKDMVKNGEYKIYLVKEDGQWKIDDIVLLEEAE